MGIIYTIIIGFFVGLVARLVKPGRDKAGFIVTTIIGILGAFLGAFIGRTLGWYEAEEAAGFLMSVLGAVILLFLYQRVARQPA